MNSSSSIHIMIQTIDGRHTSLNSSNNFTFICTELMKYKELNVLEV